MIIKGIFFDAAGVLYGRSGHTAEFAGNLLREKGYRDRISEHSQGYLEALRLKANQGVADYNAFWDQFLLLHGVADSEMRHSMTNRIIDFSNNVQPMPEGPETLAELKKRGFVLGIVTDTMYPIEWKKRRLEKAQVAEFIDIIACSTSLGVYKPDPAIYLYAIRQSNFSAGQTAFVGHLSAELDGAHSAGMMTVAVNYDQGAKADYYCKSLSELIDLPIFRLS